MKLKFTLVLLLLSLAGGFGYADYNGGQIHNQNDPSEGEPIYSGNIVINYNEDSDQWQGAVNRTGTAGSDGTTTLEGNISITTGYDYKDSDEICRNEGVYVGYDDHLNETGLVSGATVVLKTGSADDAIKIDVYGKNGQGVVVASTSEVQTSKIILDATSSGKAIVITQHHTGGGNGLSSRGSGIIEVLGDLDVTSHGGRAVAAYGGNVASDINNIVISGYLRATSTVSDGVGIYSSGQARILISGKADVEGAKHAVNTVTNGNIVFGSSVGVTVAGNYSYGTSAGFCANTGTIQLSGVHKVDNKGTGWAMYALGGGSITSLNGEYKKYTFKGQIRSEGSGSLVDLNMGDRSSYSGMTTLVNGGSINLDFQGNSVWAVTGNSTLTNLTLGQGSALQLAFGGTSLTDIISATGTITLEAGSYIYLTGDLSSLEGNSFDFFSGTVDNQGVKFVGFDGSGWVEYEYTQTGANRFEFSGNAPLDIEEPGFIPEPATATLGLLGLASLLLRRRKV